MDTNQRIVDALRNRGYKATPQRIAIAQTVLRSKNHPSAETIHEEVLRLHPTVSLSTVYNTLRAFCEAGVLQEITVDGSKSYFDTNTHDHPHFFWEDEGRLSDAPSDELVIQRLPDAPEGVEIASVDVVIRLRRKA